MKHILFIFLLTQAFTGISQEKHDFQMILGYYGEVFVIPGFKIGLEKSIKTWDRVKPNKTIHKSIRYGGDFIYYHNKNHHHGFVLAPHISYKRFRSNSKFIQFKLSSGLHRSFVDGTTYKVEDSEVISKNKIAGQNSFYGSLSLLTGARITDYISYYIEFGINGRYPYNNALYKSIYSSIGLKYSLN